VQGDVTLTRGDTGVDLGIDGFIDTQAGALADALAKNRAALPALTAPYVIPRTRHGLLEPGRADIHTDTQILGDNVHILLGRTVLLWGESLFFPENGIAGTQAAIDAPRAAADPLLDEKNLFLPAAQASVDIGLSPSASLQAYWQPEWRPNRFSDQTTNLLLPAANAAYAVLPRTRDKPGNGLDQFGVALRAQTVFGDFGLYAVRYDAKSPAAIIMPGADPHYAGSYRWAYPSGIQSFGASFSANAGQGSIAGEVSYRLRAPLLGYSATAIPSGDTLQFQVSTTGGLPPGRFWNSNSLALEIAGNEVMGVSSPTTVLPPKSTRAAVSAQLQLTPQYYHLLRGIDLAAPFGISLGLAGHSAEDENMQAGTGTLQAGFTLTRRGLRVSALLRYRIGALGVPYTGRETVFLGVQQTF
jgi:hypothetical protein